MLQFFGITELIGDCNTGKTSICIEESKKYNTVYIISTNFPIKRLDKNYSNIYIQFVQDLDDLFFTLRKINSSIELIVIDNLSSLVYLDKYSYKRIISLIYYLKKLILKYNIKVLLVNNCNTNIEKSNIYFSYKFGLEFEYQINTRYYIYKNNNEIYIKLIKVPIDFDIAFKVLISSKKVYYEII